MAQRRRLARRARNRVTGRVVDRSAIRFRPPLSSVLSIVGRAASGIRSAPRPIVSNRTPRSRSPRRFHPQKRPQAARKRMLTSATAQLSDDRTASGTGFRSRPRVPHPPRRRRTPRCPATAAIPAAPPSTPFPSMMMIATWALLPVSMYRSLIAHRHSLTRCLSARFSQP